MKFQLTQGTGSYSVVPEGEQILKITKCEAKPSGNPQVIEIEYTHDNGGVIKSTFDLHNEKGLMVLSILVNKVLGYTDTFDTDNCDLLVNKSIKGEIKHAHVQSKKDPEKTVTYANLVKIIESVNTTSSDDEVPFDID